MKSMKTVIAVTFASIIFILMCGVLDLAVAGVIFLIIRFFQTLDAFQTAKWIFIIPFAFQCIILIPFIANYNEEEDNKSGT